MTESSLAYRNIGPGFRDPVTDAQVAFRLVLDATSHPGRIVELPAGLPATEDSGLSPAAAAFALTLLDFETPVWLDASLKHAAESLRFHCSAPIVAHPNECRFAFSADVRTLPSLTSFDLGTPDFPERSTTLAIEVPDLAKGAGVNLRGPGIADTTSLRIDGIEPSFWVRRAELAGLFPLGIDLVFTNGRRLCAVPRTTIVEV